MTIRQFRAGYVANPNVLFVDVRDCRSWSATENSGGISCFQGMLEFYATLRALSQADFASGKQILLTALAAGVPR